MKYMVTVPPGEYPVTLNEIKEHLRLSSVSLSTDITTEQTIAPDEYAIGDQTGTGIEILAQRVLVNLNAGDVGGTLDVSVEDSPDNIVWTNVHDFAQVDPANDEQIYEYEYTGVERYVRAVGTVAGGAATYSVDIIISTPYSAEDDLLTALIAAATDHTETYLRKKLITQEMKLHLDNWPTMPYEFAWQPIQSVDGIDYYDTDNVLGTVPAATYFTDDTKGRIGFEYGQTWPSASLRDLDSVVVAITVGYGDASDVPVLIKRALLILIAHLYENREMVMLTGAVPKELPMSYHSLLFPYRHKRFR